MLWLHWHHWHWIKHLILRLKWHLLLKHVWNILIEFRESLLFLIEGVNLTLIFDLADDELREIDFSDAFVD